MTIGFADLATWQSLPFEDASERFDFMGATNDSVDYGDVFSEEPAHLMVHEGDVRASGNVTLDGQTLPDGARETVYIIDGDLDIDGALVFEQADIMTTLWVTGTVTVQRLALMSCGMLLVGKALRVGDILVTDLEDAGHLIVHGALTAPTWIDLAQGRGAIELAKQPTTTFLSDYFADQAADDADDDDGDDDDDDEKAITPAKIPSAPASPAILPALCDGERPNGTKIVDAIRSGAPILR